ncbi:MAG: IPT/TIG domain-containing protein [Bacteroidota bacterium]
MPLKIFFVTATVIMLFVSACEDQGDPVSSSVPVPEISSITPDSASVGDTISIAGKNFTSTKGTVKFGSVNADTIVLWSDTLIRVKVPASAVTGEVVVTANGKNSNSKQFKMIGTVTTVSFATDILQNVFNNSTYGCTGCHGGTNNLFLTSYSNVMAGNSTRGPVVVANDTTSLLIRKLKGGSALGPGEGVRMPQGGDPISDSDLRKVITWIKEGALNN